MERPVAKNAIGRDMLRGLQQTFDAIEKDHSANVVMICSSVPKVFCAGADLKVILVKFSTLVFWVCNWTTVAGKVFLFVCLEC